tara:strand:+ start:1540 stop:1896 length:357 start_codon:yes stop_codon:yes gene_type:complete
MSKVEFNIGDWRNKHIVKEGVGGVISKNPFGKMNGMFRTETVDHIDDKEAGQDYDELDDKDLDNDGDTDASDKYLHKRQGKVAKVTEAEGEDEEVSEEEFNIQEWQKRFLDKRNLKWG